MDTKLGHETDALTFLLDVAREPYRYDFYQTLRRLECLYADKPRWGRALRPVDEPIRLGQDRARRSLAACSLIGPCLTAGLGIAESGQELFL